MSLRVDAVLGVDGVCSYCRNRFSIYYDYTRKIMVYARRRLCKCKYKNVDGASLQNVPRQESRGSKNTGLHNLRESTAAVLPDVMTDTVF